MALVEAGVAKRMIEYPGTGRISVIYVILDIGNLVKSKLEVPASEMKRIESVDVNKGSAVVVELDNLRIIILKRIGYCKMVFWTKHT